MRLPFPTDKDFDARVKRLVDNTRKVLTDSGHSTVIRLGYSAIDFVTRPTKGIESFFTSEAKRSPPKDVKASTDDHKAKRKPQVKPSGINAFFLSSKKEASTSCSKQSNTLKNDKSSSNLTANANPDSSLGMAKVVSDTDAVLISEDVQQDKPTMTDEEFARGLQNAYDKELRTTPNTATVMQPKNELDRDEAIALKLQTTYDREYAVLSCVEKFPTSQKRNGKCNTESGAHASKKSKIDSYFSLKK